MFDIGFQELIIIFVVALLVFGPEKLPEISRTLGRWVIEVRRGINVAKSELENEFSDIEKVKSDEMNASAEPSVPPLPSGNSDDLTAEKKDTV